MWCGVDAMVKSAAAVNTNEEGGSAIEEEEIQKCVEVHLCCGHGRVKVGML